MIYHYTKKLYLPSILKNGLLPTDLFISPGEKPVNWFSTNPLWERTVLMVDAPMIYEAHEKMRALGGLARIICHDSVAPHRWKELKEIARIPNCIAKHLYSSAITVGSRPGEWRGTLEIVPAEKFLAVETYDGTAWIPLCGSRRKAA